MSLLLSSLLALLELLALLGAAPPPAAEMSQSVLHRALVSQAQLDADATSESFQVSDEILCAALANNDPWCYLLTYNGTTCVMYDVEVNSLDATAADTTAPCRTSFRSVCIEDGAKLPHGAMTVQDCQPDLCWNRAVISGNTASTTCDGDFLQDALGCVYLHQVAMTWCDARQYCATLGADLATASALEFPIMRAFLKATASGAQVWVGVRSRMWLDGRNVADDEWASTDPNGSLDECARMFFEGGINYALADRVCSASFIFLCRRPV